MKNGQKVFALNLLFALPDDFNGDLNDALAEVIKYRKSRNLKNLKKEHETSNFGWDHFINALYETDKRLNMKVSFSQYDEEFNEMKEIKLFED